MSGKIFKMITDSFYGLLTTCGDIVVRGASVPERLAAGTNDYILTANGAGSKPSWQAAAGGATKEFFVPCTGVNGGAMGYDLTYPVGVLTNSLQEALISFRVPHDYNSIVTASIVVVPKYSSVTANWDIYSNYAQTGESYTTHTQNNTASTYNVTSGQVFEVDISGILTSLAAGDMVGISLKQSTAIHNVNVLGVRFKYS